MISVRATLLLAIFLPVCSEAADYYLSSLGSDSAGRGTRDAPWMTFARADAAVKPGDTVYVLPGRYQITGTIKTTKSGSATAPIRWVSEKRWGAVIVSSGYKWDARTDTSTGPNFTWHNSGDYVEIQGFDISGDGHIGIYNTGSYVTIRGNNVHHIAAPNQCGDAEYPPQPKYLHGAAGIDTDRSTNVTVVENYVHDLAPQDPICGSGAHGIYFAHPGPHWIQDNVILRVQGNGINTWHRANQITISSNTVLGRGYTGINVGNDPAVPHTYAEYFTVMNNVVAHFQYFGIRENGSVGMNNRYGGNVAFKNRNSTTPKYNFSLQTGIDLGNKVADPLCVGSPETDLHNVCKLP